MRLDFLFCALVLAGCGASAPAKDPVCPLATPAPTVPESPHDGLDALDDEHLVRKLLDVTNASNLGKQVADSMMETFRKMPALPSGFVDRFKANLRPETLVELVVPIYLKYYDRKTLIAMIRFYDTEAGRKLVAQSPAVTKETMEAGKAWGTALAEKTMKQIGPP